MRIPEHPLAWRDGIHTTTPAGRLICHVFASLDIASQTRKTRAAHCTPSLFTGTQRTAASHIAPAPAGSFFWRYRKA